MKNLELALLLLFHPVDAFLRIKQEREERGYLPGIILLALVMVIRVLQIHLTHFPLATLDPSDANLGSEMFKMVVPLVSWMIACFGVTTIMEGKMTFRETFTASSYSMLPFIVLVIPFTLLSRILSGGDAVFLNTLYSLMWSWIGILIFMNVQVLNEYGFWKTVFIVGLSFFGILLIWVSVGIAITLTNQFYQFIKDVVVEIVIRLSE
ncbi:MAG: YIP1 family protein [Spirochaetales bacterium]|nr:YIP1 family protein [Spirochaetales bacterium]